MPRNSSQTFRVAVGRCLVQLLCLGFITTVSSATDALTTVKSEGSTELTYKAPSGNIVRIEISQSKLDLSSFLYQDALLWGGDVGQLPHTILSSIQISQNRKTVFVTLSAYSDLGDVKFASLEPAKEGFDLHLYGATRRLRMTQHLAFRRGI